MRTLVVSSLVMLTAACGREDTARVAPSPMESPPAATQEPTAATPGQLVELAPTQGHTAAGTLTFTPGGDGVRITGVVRGLEPSSVHGMHIHENGDCSAPDASSAGDHFAPLGKPHGPPGETSHVGDLGNITADAEGVATVDVRAVQATLGTDVPTDISGRALIVHASADDLNSQPSGESGARIACGVIS